ncbi:hypothetical protein L593_13310 [Salinarchaeum sp. Harcht-Bsk1]|uniref:hypothetical protein n=1 Tax=Salinarchaeum sp. Harcht-Bsk1 TaxID=1333523 RepID=UPI00034235F8|nr:hypothetical protein [Salinarchaeum sp. Harcht-Bsk1]AGN02601.1 hypothetical protein L593_13310 [Salinarchaeum sp. Harcht-Bsk1]
MAVRDSRAEVRGTVSLPAVVPFSLPHLTRTSYELGTRSIEDEEATLLERWRHRSDRWALSVFAVTNETVLLRVRTPVGRARFYGAIRSELDSAFRSLAASSDWRQVD